MFVPLLYGTIWGTALLLTVFGYLEFGGTPQKNFLVATYATFIVFLFDSIVGMIDVSATNEEEQFGSNIFIMFGCQLILLIITALLGCGFYTWNCCVLKYCILGIMFLYRLGIAFFFSNVDFFLSRFRGNVFESNLG